MDPPKKKFHGDRICFKPWDLWLSYFQTNPCGKKVLEKKLKKRWYKRTTETGKTNHKMENIGTVKKNDTENSLH